MRIALGISDMDMAEMRGPDLIRDLRTGSNGRRWNVFYVTGYSDDATLDAVEGEVLAKPFLPNELATVVKRFLP